MYQCTLKWHYECSMPPSEIFYNFERSIHLQADVELKWLQGLLPGYVRGNIGPLETRPLNTYVNEGSISWS